MRRLVLSDSGLSVGRSNSNPPTDRAFQIADRWCDSTFTNKLDILGRAVNFPWHRFSGTKPKDVKHEI